MAESNYSSGRDERLVSRVVTLKQLRALNLITAAH
jgi:hypothetical protein